MDRPGYTFKDPPNYSSEEDNLGIYYQVSIIPAVAKFNITVDVAGIGERRSYRQYADRRTVWLALQGCDIEADVAGSYLQGNVGWDLGKSSEYH